jgi:hypothetical protein
MKWKLRLATLQSWAAPRWHRRLHDRGPGGLANIQVDGSWVPRVRLSDDEKKAIRLAHEARRKNKRW